MLALRIAKAWGLTPAQWRAQPPDDRAWMMAYELFTETCEAYREEWREKKRGGKPDESPGVNPYHALLASLGRKA